MVFLSTVCNQNVCVKGFLTHASIYLAVIFKGFYISKNIAPTKILRLNFVTNYKHCWHSNITKIKPFDSFIRGCMKFSVLKKLLGLCGSYVTTCSVRVYKASFGYR